MFVHDASMVTVRLAPVLPLCALALLSLVIRSCKNLETLSWDLD